LTILLGWRACSPKAPSGLPVYEPVLTNFIVALVMASLLVRALAAASFL
jgi:hypothetical protein